MADLLTRLIEHEKHMDERIEKFNRSIAPVYFDSGYAFEYAGEEYVSVHFGVDFPIILGKKELYEFLAVSYPSEKEKLEKGEKDTSSFIQAMKRWRFDNNNLALLNTLRRWVLHVRESSEISEYRIDIHEKYPELEGYSLYGLLQLKWEILPCILYKALPPGDIVTKAVRLSENINKIISRTDMVIYMLRAELGIKSFAEIHDLKSMLGYLEYRLSWWLKYEPDLNKDAVTLLIEKYRDECYKKNHPISFFEFVSSHGGIQGELWASYDEFYHDEWQDESYRSELSERIGDID